MDARIEITSLHAELSGTYRLPAGMTRAIRTDHGDEHWVEVATIAARAIITDQVTIVDGLHFAVEYRQVNQLNEAVFNWFASTKPTE